MVGFCFLSRNPTSIENPTMDPKPETLVYVCGDCGTEDVAKPGDITQCKECGYRILFKKRTRRIIQVVAR